EVPARAHRTDDPESTLPRVERDLTPDGKRLDRFVRAQRARAEDAAAIHAPKLTSSAGRVRNVDHCMSISPVSSHRQWRRIVCNRGGRPSRDSTGWLRTMWKYVSPCCPIVMLPVKFVRSVSAAM